MAEKRSDKELEKHLKTLKGQRTWKKGAITKRIRKLEALVNDGGSRRVIAAAVVGLQTVFEELNQVCASIAAMIEDVDDLNSLEDIRMDVEMCVAMANEDLEARKDDPPSSADSTSTWVNQHAEVAGNGADAPAEDEQRSEDFPDEAQSEVILEDSGNICKDVWNYSPLYSIDPPANGTGTGAIPRIQSHGNVFDYENINSLNNDDHQSQGGQQEVWVRPKPRPLTSDNLTSYGVYDESSISALKGKSDQVDFHCEGKKWESNGARGLAQRNGSLSELQQKGSGGQIGGWSGSLPDIERKKDDQLNVNSRENGSAWNNSREIDRGLRVSGKESGMHYDFCANNLNQSLFSDTVLKDSKNTFSYGIQTSGEEAERVAPSNVLSGDEVPGERKLPVGMNPSSSGGWATQDQSELCNLENRILPTADTCYNVVGGTKKNQKRC